MADYSERAASQGFWRPPSVRHTNAMIDLAERHLQQQLGGPRQRPQVVRRENTVLVKNSTGGNLDRGGVLQLGDLLNTGSPGTDAWLFDGEDPAPDGADTIAVVLSAAKTTAVVEAAVSGLVFCRLDVNHVQHKFADVDTASNVLQSHWHGRAEILWTSTATTGEQDAIVRLGQMFRGPIKAAITEAGGITSGGSGEVTIYHAGVAASPAATETAYLNWMSGGAAGEEDAECLIEWFPDEQKYVIVALECSG